MKKKIILQIQGNELDSWVIESQDQEIRALRAIDDILHNKKISVDTLGSTEDFPALNALLAEKFDDPYNILNSVTEIDLETNQQTNSMNKDLYLVYNLATEYLAPQTNISPIEVLGKAADVYVNYANELPNDSLKEVCGKCLCFINHDFEEDMTIKEWIAYGDELIEELSAYIGAWLDQ